MVSVQFQGAGCVPSYFLLVKALHIHFSELGFLYMVEEVSMKWMDRPSVTEMETGRVYEMDRRKKCQKMEMALK